MKLKSFFFIFIFLCSCSSNEEVSTDKNKQIVYGYDDVMNYQILFDDIFSQNENLYFVYIYSKTCGHCNQIKNDILKYRLEENKPLYFLEYNESIPISDDVSSTINSKSIFDVCILGTPTLLTIYEKTLVSNVAGTNKILKEIALYSIE